MSTTVHRDWLRLILEADGLAEYHESPRFRHRVDWEGRGLSLLSMALVGFLVVSAAIGVARSRPQVTAASDALRERVASEQARTAVAEERYTAARELLRQTQDAVRPDLNGELATAVDVQGMAAAYVGLKGPGVMLVLDDSARPSFSGTTDLGRIIDRDVQHAVNALWQAGAEGIAINGVRLTARTSIRNAGTAILVDYKPVATPLRIRAIGAPVRMLNAFRDLPEWEELSALRDRYRIRWSIGTDAALTLPAGASALPTVATPEGGS